MKNKKNRSLFKEFMEFGELDSYNSVATELEIPIKEQLQRLLANLPDEDQLAAFEGDLITLKRSVQAMKFESPSITSNVNQLASDTFIIRDKLHSVISRISQLLRDMSLKKADPQNLKNLEGGSMESHIMREEKEWSGLSGKYSVKSLIKKFGKDKIKAGLKVEKEHTTDDKMAIRIVLDHLVEDENYYTKLKKAGL